MRYNPEGDAALNQRQAARLKQLSDYLHAQEPHCSCSSCWCRRRRPSSTSVDGDKKAYDRELRPGLMVRGDPASCRTPASRPDVWKIEGLDRREDCEKVVAAAQRGGRDKVGCIILGRGEDDKKVREWLATAAAGAGLHRLRRRPHDLLGARSSTGGTRRLTARGRGGRDRPPLPRVGRHLREGRLPNDGRRCQPRRVIVSQRGAGWLA